MRALSLRLKTMLFGGAMLLLLALVANLVLRERLMSDFLAAEEHVVAANVQRACALVQDRRGSLDRLVRDWARWDDTYAYIVDRNEPYRRSNLQSDNFRDLQVDEVLLLGGHGELIYGSSLTPDGRRAARPPLELRAMAQPGHPLGSGRPEGGLLMTSSGALLASAWPVVHSDGSGPPRGTLVFGRYLDEDELAHLSLLAGMRLELRPLAELPPSNTTTAEGVRVLPLSHELIAGCAPLQDVADRDVLMLKVTDRRDLYQRGHQAMGEFSRALAILVAIPGLLLLLGLELLLLRRVARASAGLARVAATGDVAARIPSDGQDELGRLVAGINDALAAIEQGVLRQNAASQEMEHLRQLLDAVITHTPLPLFVKEAGSGRYVVWNHAIEELTALPAAQVLGRTDFDVHPPEQAELFRQRDREVLQTGTLLDTPAEEVVLRGGKMVRLLHTRKVPLSPLAGGPGYVLAILEDITEHRAQQAQLQRSLEELARSNTELEQFAYVASHDLQEPLRMVASYVQLLARRYEGQLDERADQYIGFAVDGALRMQSLINDLLAYSRVGTQGREFATVDLENVLRTTLQNLQVTLTESGATVTHDPLPEVWGDEAQLVQLFQNLIGNAIKFRRDEPPRAQVSVAREGDLWRICVADNGIGIESQYLERIFAIFQRLHGRRLYPGTGIGLAICRRIVERHGGRITAASEPGQGSTFCLTLPGIPEAPS